MSPGTKNILMIGGAVVAGYFIYTKVIKKPAAYPTAVAPPPANMTTALKTAAVDYAVSKIGNVEYSLGLSEELGLHEELGSLGGGGW